MSHASDLLPAGAPPATHLLRGAHRVLDSRTRFRGGGESTKLGENDAI
jgi:hypothetical protein